MCRKPPQAAAETRPGITLVMPESRAFVSRYRRGKKGVKRGGTRTRRRRYQVVKAIQKANLLLEGEKKKVRKPQRSGEEDMLHETSEKEIDPQPHKIKRPALTDKLRYHLQLKTAKHDRRVVATVDPERRVHMTERSLGWSRVNVHFRQRHAGKTANKPATGQCGEKEHAGGTPSKGKSPWSCRDDDNKL